MITLRLSNLRIWQISALIILAATLSIARGGQEMQSIYNIKVKDINGEEFSLERYRGKVMLIVNVASKCGFTPQYDGLEALYTKYKDQGLVILGFPCNQFGGQEPGNEEEIQNFCRINYGVSFHLFSKIEVNGPGSHPLYTFLKAAKPGIMGSEAIKWNFTKFLVDREGRVVERFDSAKKPRQLQGNIESLL
jgi:glutathione peroxidase